MRKFIFILIISIIFVSCKENTTKVKVISPNGIESTAYFEDFFNFEIIISNDNDDYPLKIMMDKNTGVLYVINYYGISPMYDSDGTIMTKEKWFAKRFEKRD